MSGWARLAFATFEVVSWRYTEAWSYWGRVISFFADLRGGQGCPGMFVWAVVYQDRSRAVVGVLVGCCSNGGLL